MAIIWIANLKQPLPLAALLESLSVGKGHRPAELDASVVDRCDGLVMVDEGTSCVHLALYEIDETAKEIWPGSYDSTVCMLATTCLNYLMLAEFGSGCLETEEELIQLLAAHPFLNYAARCWAYHTRDACEIQFGHANAKPERDQKLESVMAPGTEADDSSQGGEPDVKVLPLNDSNGNACEEDVENDDTDMKGMQNPSMTSGPAIQENAETFLETPNSLLALQILLYRDKAAAPFPNQWAVHKEKINSMSKLQKAARFGLTTLVDKWAPNSLDLCEKDSEGSTALHEAAKEGFEDVIERLAKYNSLLILMTNDYKKTPMHLAMARGHHKAFSILFEMACAGVWEVGLAEFWRERVEGDRPLRDRYQRESLRKERLRRDHAMFVNVEGGDEFITSYSIHNSGISNDPKRSREIALTKAINLRKEAVVFILLHTGVDGNCRDEVDVPAVHLAIEIGSLPILQLLLDKDADPEVKAYNRDGESTLHLAARLGLPDIVELLLGEGVDLLDVDEKGRTILFSALEASDVQAGHDIIRILLVNGIDVRKEDQTGRNILHAAAEKGNSRALRSLIYRVQDHSHKDAQGKTPFDYAHEGGHEDAERILREWSG